MLVNSPMTQNYNPQSVVIHSFDDKKTHAHRRRVSTPQLPKTVFVISSNDLCMQPVKGAVIYTKIMADLKEKQENPKLTNKNLDKIEEVLIENKVEIQKALDYAYHKLNDKYKFSLSEFDFNEWSPTKSPQEAQEFVSGSRTARGTYYRGSNNPELTKQNGYSLKRVNADYPGIYTSDSYSTARQYGDNPLKLKIRANNVVKLDGWDGFEQHLFNSLNTKITDKQTIKTLEGIKGIVELEMGKKLNIDAFTKRVQAFEEDEPSEALIVTNPKNIVIIE